MKSGTGQGRATETADGFDRPDVRHAGSTNRQVRSLLPQQNPTPVRFEAALFVVRADDASVFKVRGASPPIVSSRLGLPTSRDATMLIPSIRNDCLPESIANKSTAMIPSVLLAELSRTRIKKRPFLNTLPFIADKFKNAAYGKSDIRVGNVFYAPFMKPLRYAALHSGQRLTPSPAPEAARTPRR